MDIVEQSEASKASFNITRDGDGFRIASPHVDIAGNREPLGFLVAARKLPTSVDLGESIENITIDNESPKVQQMRKEAAELQALPERERIRPLLALVKKNIQYAYPGAMEELRQIDPEKAKWVEEHTGLMSSRAIPHTLSEIVDGGYGVCRHLTVAMLALAKDAGLQGAHFVYQPSQDPESQIKNVVRKDTGETIFQSVGVEEPFLSAHTYIELLADDAWIPVDPTTELIGDTPDGMETFREANYRGDISRALRVDGLPIDTFGVPTTSLQFLPGEQTKTGLFFVNGVKKDKPIRVGAPKIDEVSTEVWPQYPRYQGELSLTLSPQKSYTGTNIELVSVALGK